MKFRLHLTIMAAIILTGCNNEKSPVEQAPQQVQTKNEKSLDVKVEYRDVLTNLSIEGVDYFFIPTQLTFKVAKKEVEILGRKSKQKVAVIRVEDKDTKALVDNSGANPTFVIKGESKQLEIEVLDYKLLDDIVSHNFYDRVAFNTKKLEGNTISIQKENTSPKLADYVEPVSEAPIQKLMSNVLGMGPAKQGTYEFWFDDELKMVKENQRSSSALRTYEIIPSIDLSLGDNPNIKVEASLSNLSEQYHLLTIDVTNKVDEGAFVTSNPVYAFGPDCIKFPYTNSIKSQRIEDGIRYTLAFKKGFDNKCLTESNLNGKIYVFDSKLNWSEVIF